MKWLSIEQAAKYLHRDINVISAAIRSGEIEAYRPPRQSRGVIVSTDALDAYVYGTYEPAMELNAARRVIARAGR